MRPRPAGATTRSPARPRTQGARGTKGAGSAVCAVGKLEWARSARPLSPLYPVPVVDPVPLRSFGCARMSVCWSPQRDGYQRGGLRHHVARPASAPLFCMARSAHVRARALKTAHLIRFISKTPSSHNHAEERMHSTRVRSMAAAPCCESDVSFRRRSMATGTCCRNWAVAQR